MAVDKYGSFNEWFMPLTYIYLLLHRNKKLEMVTVKPLMMNTLLNLKKMYLDAFENCGPNYLVAFLKVYSIFCAVLWSVTFYAFLYRAFTGFRF